MKRNSWSDSEIMFLYKNIDVCHDELREMFEHRRKVYGGVPRTGLAIVNRRVIISRACEYIENGGSCFHDVGDRYKKDIKKVAKVIRANGIKDIKPIKYNVRYKQRVSWDVRETMFIYENKDMERGKLYKLYMNQDWAKDRKEHTVATRISLVRSADRLNKFGQSMLEGKTKMHKTLLGNIAKVIRDNTNTVQSQPVKPITKPKIQSVKRPEPKEQPPEIIAKPKDNKSTIIVLVAMCALFLGIMAGYIISGQIQ